MPVHAKIKSAVSIGTRESIKLAIYRPAICPPYIGSPIKFLSFLPARKT